MAGDLKVLLLRIEVGLVAHLDEARGRVRLRSRIEFCRLALHTFLDGRGGAEVASPFRRRA